MSEIFDAYHIWLGIKPEDQPPNCYRLLAIDLFEENADAIANAADRQMAHIRSFQAGQHSALSQKILNEISAARICLLNPQKKAAYDAKLRQELALKQPVASADPPRIELGFDVSPRPRPPVHKASPQTQWPSWQIVAAIAAVAILLFVAVAAIFLGGGEKAVIPADSHNRLPSAKTETVPPEPPKVAKAVQQASAEPPKVAPPAAERKPRPAMPTFGEQYADILPWVDPKLDCVTGEWTKNGTAVANTSFGARIALPVKVAGEYDLETTFTRREGKDTLAIVLPVGSHACDIALSSWEGQAHGLEAIDGQDSRSNPTTRSPGTLINGQRYTLLAKVRIRDQLASIEVLLDNAPLFRWQGKETSLAPLGEFSLPHPDQIGLGVFRSLATFHSVRLRVISGEASWTEPQRAGPKESSPIAVGLPKPAEPQAPTDPPEKVAEVVKAAFAQAKSPDDFRSVAVDAFQLMEQAKAAGKRDVARSAVTLALAAARKANDDELVKTATICVLDPKSKPVVNEDPSWIDILPRVDLQRDRVEGDWETTGKAVTVNKSPRPTLMLPVRIEGEYDLLLRFTRYAGSDTLYVVLPVESQCCGVVLSGWFGAWSGLELIDGQEANNSNNPTRRRPRTLTNGKEYTLLVKVRLENQMAIIEALLDNSLLLHWEGKPSSLTFHGDRKLPQPQRIGLGAIDSQVTFHSAKLHLISGSASWADGGEIEGPAAAGDKQTRSIPGAAAQERALRLARELFQDKSSRATTSQQQKALAQELLQTARSTNDNATAQYVMLKEAGRFAVQAKDVALAFQVIEEMASRFKVDAFDLQVKSLTAICKGSLPQQQTSTVAGQALALAEEALTKEEFDTAKQLGTLATEAARKSRDAAFIKETGSRTRAIAKEPAELREAQAGVEEAVAVLEKSAIDTAANLTLGKYRCFLKNLWSEGLPMLALGDDPTLKDLAARELKGVTDPAEQAKLGDGWWGVGEEKTGLAQRNIQAHAGNWYQDALPGLTGLVKEKTEKRLRESPCQVLAERMTGDLVQFISLEPNNNEFSRTGVIGGTWGSPYEDFPHPRCLLVGFHITTSSTSEKTPVAKSVQPVYVGPGRTTGSRVYAKAEGKTITVEAMKGYAVAGIVGRGGTKVDGFKVIFMRVGRTSLDRRHSYESDWIGGQGGGEEKKLGGDGRPVVGIYGKCGDDLNSLGLIQAK